jgi:hypothetical protein
MKNNQLFYIGTVIDVRCRKRANRIRAKVQTEDIQGILDSVAKKYNIKDIFNEDKTDLNKKYWYKKFDPFVYIPFLPRHLDIVPEPNELVLILYLNADNNIGRINQFYVPGPKSDPRNLKFENSETSKSIMLEGLNYGGTSNILDENGELAFTDSYGVFPEPQDNAILGKNATDVVLKTDVPTVLLRAGVSNNINQNENPVPNNNMGSLQITYFDGNKISYPEKKSKKLEIPNIGLKKLIEYDIIVGLENTVDSYTGSVKLYNLPELKDLTSLNFNFDTPLPSISNVPLFQYDFQAKPMSAVTEIVNTFIKGLNNGEIIFDDDNKTSFKPSGEIFPFFYRPSLNVRNILNLTPDPNTQPTDLIKKINATTLYQDVKFSESIKTPGFGIVMEKDKFGKQFKMTETVTKPSSYTNEKISVSLLRSNEIYLLSYGTSVGTNPAISFTNQTNYGIDTDFISNEINPKTEPMVRGESLKELLNLIVLFLTTHVHPYHGTPPVPVTNATSLQELQSELEKYDTKVLNSKIRIS